MIAADVWMALVTTWSEALGCCWAPGMRPWPCWPCGLSAACVVTGRLSALTMPVVTVPDRPSGLPMAMTGWPTTTCDESPMDIGTRSLGGLLSSRTARSVDGSVPTIFAS